MTAHFDGAVEPERYEFSEKPRYRFSVSRRAFLQSMGAGLAVLTFAEGVSGPEAWAQGGGTPTGRLEIGTDGTVTVFTGKVEVGQGSRTQIAMAAAEELGVPLDDVRVVMSDTDRAPNDGGTFGSHTTPRTVPEVREAAAAARTILIELACERWDADPADGAIQDGVIRHPGGGEITLAELASDTDMDEALAGRSVESPAVTAVADWRVLGESAPKADAEAIVTGAHRYPSDVRRPGMRYGKVLRAPAYEARLVDVDTAAAEAMEGVTVVRDGDFVGCAAPTTRQARRAVEALAEGAEWELGDHPSSADLFEYLKANTGSGGGRFSSQEDTEGDVAEAMENGAATVRGSYKVPYIQHAPMEPRAAAAEWDGEGRLTVWTGTQRPFDVRNDVADAFGLQRGQVRLIMPDTGGGFGGKHTGDAAIEAAKLAQGAGHPVSLQWTRDEEFAWAYFRPAGLLETAGAVDSDGRITAWDFTNYNSGRAALQSPYNTPNKRERFQFCDSPLREGSYRALAAVANAFAREAFIDRLAAAADMDPLAFRLLNLPNGRLRDVLEAAAERFGWSAGWPDAPADRGYGIACGTEKGSYVATAAEIALDGDGGFEVERLCVVFECGAVQHPRNLRAQIEGCVIMGLGAALTEEIHFEDGKILNGRFNAYPVPRFRDTPPMDIEVLDRRDLPSAGAGETPIIAVAPAIANALFQATGEPREKLPLA